MAKCSILVAFVAGLLTLSASPAAADCFSAKEVRSKSACHWAAYVLRHADVIVDATVVQRFKGGRAEVLEAHHVHKGPRQNRFTLALPPGDYLSTAHPTTGRAEGTRTLVALHRGRLGYHINECTDGVLGRADVRALIASRR